MTLSYDDAVKYIADNPRRGKQGAPMEVSASGGRTRYVWLTPISNGPSGVIAVSLFGHTIATIHEDGRYVLDSCGYATPTTRDALNAILGPMAVGSRDKVWWYCGVHPFRDGMTVQPNAGMMVPAVSYRFADQAQVVYDDPRKR